MNILVVGASGYIGGRLVPLLQAGGHDLVLMSRDARTLAARFPAARVVAADLLEPSTLPPALEGIEIAYYLAHSMGAGERGFAERDRQAARNFAQAARRAGVSRIVYLGGLGDDASDLSHHLASRHETGAELDDVDRHLRLFGRNRRAVAAFRDADHLPVPATDVAADVRAHLRAEGEDPAGWQIVLVTNLRVLGYVFNPASFFLCRDGSGTLRVVVIEVHNTFGGRHLYTLRPGDGQEGPAGPFTAGMDKDFFVSPFISMDGRYSVHVRDEPAALKLAINLRQDGEPLLSTSLVLRRLRLTDRNLLRLLLEHPLVTQKTMGLILYHALRLWLRGAPFFRHGEVMRAKEAAR